MTIEELLKKNQKLIKEKEELKFCVLKASDQYIKLYNFVSDRDEKLIKEFIEEYCKNENDSTKVNNTNS